MSLKAYVSRLVAIATFSGLLWIACGPSGTESKLFLRNLTPDAKAGETVELEVEAKNADGSAGLGIVEFSAAAGAFEDGSKTSSMILEKGKATIHYVCDPAVNPKCAKNVVIGAKWNSVPATVTLLGDGTVVGGDDAGFTDAGQLDAGEPDAGPIAFGAQCFGPRSFYVEGTAYLVTHGEKPRGDILFKDLNFSSGATSEDFFFGFSVPTDAGQSDYEVQFSPPLEQSLTSGTYQVVGHFPALDAGILRLDTDFGGFCDDPLGSFTVHNPEFYADHRLKRGSVTFEGEACDGDPSKWVRGCLNYEDPALAPDASTPPELLPMGSCVFPPDAVVAVGSVGQGQYAIFAVDPADGGEEVCLGLDHRPYRVVVRPDGHVAYEYGGSGVNPFPALLVADALERPQGSASGTPWSFPKYPLANDGYLPVPGCGGNYIEDFAISPNGTFGYSCSFYVAAGNQRWGGAGFSGFDGFYIAALADGPRAFLTKYPDLYELALPGVVQPVPVSGLGNFTRMIGARARPDGFNVALSTLADGIELWNVDFAGTATLLATFGGVDQDAVSGGALTKDAIYVILKEDPRDGGEPQPAAIRKFEILADGGVDDAGIEIFRSTPLSQDFVTPSLHPQLTGPLGFAP